MSSRKLKRSLASMAFAVTLIATTPAAPAQARVPAADPFRQSVESAAQGSSAAHRSLYFNPLTAPSAIGVSLSSMTWHYLIWCPVAMYLGSEGTDMGRCSF